MGPIVKLLAKASKKFFITSNCRLPMLPLVSSMIGTSTQRGHAVLLTRKTRTD